MDIYKLNDELLEKAGERKTKRGEQVNFCEDETDVGGGLKVTDLKQGVKNPNRVNVFIDGAYALSLDVAQVVDLGVKVGKVLDEAELNELRRASEFGKAYQRALEWVLVRPRSVRELRDYLKRRGVRGEMEEKKRKWEVEREITDLISRGEDYKAKRIQKRIESATKPKKYNFDDLIVHRLCERGYVSDEAFARWYVENRFVKKGVSRKRLAMELRGKGVDADIIENVLGDRDEEEEIQKMIARKRGRYDDEKLTAYLCRQGFSYDLVKKIVEES